MKIFFDSDVLLDFLLKRNPFDVPIKELLELATSKRAELCTSVLAGANMHYILSKHLGKEKAAGLIEIITNKIKPLSILESTFRNAQKSTFKDFEDAIQYNCCAENGIDFIITRNIKDYKQSSIPVFKADQMIVHILKNF